jgi:uncharacterized phage protein gp47/JayE
MPELVPAPDLDVRSVEQIAAQAIGFTCAPLTVERVDFQIGVMRELRALVEAGGVTQPVCPELTNANVGSAHTILLEVFAWLVAVIARRINVLPVKVQVEFARLFGIELREATRAATMLRFTVAPPTPQQVTIPAGATVKSQDGAYTFTTSASLVLASGVTTGDVGALRDVTGATTLSPGVLIALSDPIAWVQSVTNPEAVESGTDAEPVSSALARARRYQRRGERLVSAQDFEDAVLDDVLLGNGIVKAFPFVRGAEYGSMEAGHTTMVVMTRAGDPVSAAVKLQIASVLQQAVGNQFVYVADPSFVDFTITADVRLTGLVPQDAILAAVRKTLTDFYAPTSGNFGRSVYQSDIIALVERSEGVERIVRQPGGELLALPAADLPVAPYQLPRLVAVNLTPVT